MVIAGETTIDPELSRHLAADAADNAQRPGRRTGNALLQAALLLAAATKLAGAEDAGERAGSAAADRPLEPAEAARTMVVPEGFTVTCFAAEPDVRQPISFAVDDCGRLWVAEAYNYPERSGRPADRVVVLEDRDGDGRSDRRQVFFEGLAYATGIEVGFGGVWVMSPPEMLFIPDRNGDGEPDGPPEVLLDGFGTRESAHNIANGFTWGPDGWLYGGHGRTSPSDVGRPGTPAAERLHFDGGVYRYHPTRRVFEGFADGTTNPWGVDFDDYGQAFVSNCVNPHLYHVIEGARFEPWRGRESSRYAYERLPTIADHVHWRGGPVGHEQRGYIPALRTEGGGHAHSGVLVYLGDSWPERYRNTVLLSNIHGRRLNNDILERQGSSYIARHGEDLMVARDPWFMGVTLRAGPDGSVYVSDWSDTGECHSYKETRRETGRIYRIAYGRALPAASPDAAPGIDHGALDDRALVRLQLHRNDWHVRTARRRLQERAAAGADLTAARADLAAMFRSNSDVTRKLRALWALHVTGGAGEALLLEALGRGSGEKAESEYVRAWAARLLAEEPPGRAALAGLARAAADDPSPFVRLHLASALGRLPLAERWEIARGLAARAEDAGDPNLPLMLWYGIEPLVKADPARALDLARTTRIPLVRRFIARRAAEGE
jgi:putative membrane-bound dehydrogenase-like protein